MDNPLVVLAPSSHPPTGRKRIPFKTLGKEKFLTRERGSGTRIALERFFAERDTPLNIRMFSCLCPIISEFEQHDEHV